MALMEWSEAFSVGVASIDEQHKKLINMLNALQFAVEQGQEGEVLHEIFEGLVLYTQKHFSFEEQLLDEHGYAQAEEHKREHKVLKDQVMILQQRFEAGEGMLSDALLEFLRQWLSDHIQGADRDLGVHLQSRKVS